MPGRNVIKGKQLYRVLFYGVILTALTMGILVFWGVREVRRDAAVVAVENSARGLGGAVTVLVNAVTKSNDEIGAAGLSSLSPKALRARYRSMLAGHAALEAVLVSDEKGLRYSLAKRADGIVELVPGRGTENALRWTLLGKGGSATPTSPEWPFDREALDKGLADEWAHLQPGQVNWRSVYRFYASGEALLAASTPVEAKGEKLMISYVFPVKAVLRQLGGAEKGGAERIFLYWDSGKVLPVREVTDGGGDDAAVHIEEAGQIEDQVVDAAIQRLDKDPGQKGKPFRYSLDGEVWWAYVLPLSVFGDTISLGVAVPMANVVSSLTSDTFLQIFGFGLVLLAAGALLILHRNRARIEVLGMKHGMPQTPGDVLRLIAEGESSTLEFKQTLRFNLKSGKNGKEIEHASLKTVAGFLNSEGGNLLIGVADSGEVAGFSEDNFANEDKALLHFNNLVNQQIGTEFSRYIDTAVLEVQGRQVLCVHCIPAGAPAILDNGKSEEFYVRSGPASRQLTLSQFYEWLKRH
ncbi:hypothetical protein GM415_11275 [Pseudodesulfovibrio cashew]|uniref:Schlafen AlbA-2 domain-containing protein n=1 Tax=Pseudodesulfovibrio cashew TaxID=2678688 RepID=A0A6I6JHM1_9BACT|nr:ATP-binding protein [Pseudodesulfovibrio cashew]QGY40679.1 hypothetical protein GM415_11275 [Pseudodesulfovibrio cashew]